MKLKLPKALFAAILAACVSAGIAETTADATSFSFDFNFDDPILTDAAQWHSVSFITGGYRATITASGDSGVLKDGDWSTSTDIDPPLATSPDYDYIMGGDKSTSLTLTIGQLTADEKYDFSFSTGLPFEGEGKWNTVSTSNTYDSVNLPVDSENVQVRKVTNYIFEGVTINDDGEIAVTVNANGSHSATFNAATITGVAGTGISDTNVYAASATTTGNVALIVSSGENLGTNTAGIIIGAFGAAQNATLTGNAVVKLTGDFGGTCTVFGAVNAGTVTGDVSLVFDAANATYGTFTTQSNQQASVVGAYQASIEGKLSATINAGTFKYDIIGGVHTGSSSSIGSTQITINDGASIEANVYGGGREGIINGDTAVTLNSLNPFATHNASNVISAGGTGGRIDGNATLTFNGVKGEYAGIVQGEGKATVNGASKLVVSGDSDLTLNTVQDFDAIEVQTGSALTINGAITTDATLQTVFDSNTVATRTNNGLGNGIITGLVSGEGTLNVGTNVTLNDKTISGYSNGAFVVADAVYYVMGKNDSSSYTGLKDANYVYVLSADKKIALTEVVHVGNHYFETATDASGELMSGPMLVGEANAAFAHYVAKDGVLCITGDSTVSNMHAGRILTAADGDGDIILRSPGYASDPAQSRFDVHVTEASRLSGNLYLSPKLLATSAHSDDTQSMALYLDDGANISSFASVNVGSPSAELVFNGKLGCGEDGSHINNFTALGSSGTHININTSANEQIVFGGTTTISNHIYFEPVATGLTSVQLYLNFNQNSSILIERLSDGKSVENGGKLPQIYISSAAYDNYASEEEVINGSVNIDSFDFSGDIELQAIKQGKIDLSLTLEEKQMLKDSQIRARIADLNGSYKGDSSVTIKGQGTYVLSDGNSIDVSSLSNFWCTYNTGKLSQDWTGTVVVNNLDASGTKDKISGIRIADYGNADSTIHFKGFKGYLTDDATAVTIASDLKLEDSASMDAYEISNASTGQPQYSGQAQTYTGSISGGGDFVVSSSGSHSITFEGDVSGWNGALKVTQGTHTVTMSGDATTVNADIAASGNGTLGLTTAADVTYNGGVQVNSLTVNSGKSARLVKDAAVGNVSIAGYGEQTAVLSGGTGNAMQVASGLVSGGKVAGAAITFNTDAAANVLNTISDIELQNVKLSSTVANDTILLQGIRTGWTAESSVVNNNVELVGSGVTFRSVLAEGEQFAYQSAQSSEQVNHVALQTDAFAGTKLGSGAAVEVQVADAVNWGDMVNDLQTNVSIHLQGLYVDGMTIDEKIQASALPNYIKISVSGASARSTMPGVEDLLAQDFDSVTYLQQADGFLILMTHAIPEPTTTTLSLLALAALAARRRRK